MVSPLSPTGDRVLIQQDLLMCRRYLAWLLWATACGATGLVIFSAPSFPALIFILFLVNAVVMCAQLFGIIQYIGSVLPLLPAHSTQTTFQSVLVSHKTSAIEMFYFSINGLLATGVGVFYVCFGSLSLAVVWFGLGGACAVVFLEQWANFQWARMAYTSMGEVNDE